MSVKAIAEHLPFAPNKIDKVFVAFLVVLAAVFAIDGTQGVESLIFTVEQLLGVAIYLVLSIAIAAYASATGADNLIAKVFQGNIAVMIVFAALFGGVSPFCSCGVIPLIAALLAMGVPLPAVMAFWLASPIMDPSMFVLTSGILGSGFAVAKTVAAIGLGLLGGFGILMMQGNGMFADPLRDGVGNGGCAGSKVRSPKDVTWKFWQEAPRREKFAKSTLSNTWFLGKWLAIAFLLESLMLAYIPGETIAQVLGGDGVVNVIVAALVGVPAYLNGYAALPLVGGLIEQGMAPGAGMAFLVAGGVTSIPAAVAVFALARWPVFVAYIGFALLGSVAAGLAFGLTI